MFLCGREGQRHPPSDSIRILLAAACCQLKDAQHKSCELALLGAKRGLQPGRQRLFSKETLGEGQYITFRWRESSMQSSAYFTKGFLLIIRSRCHHGRIWCFSRYVEMEGLGSWNQFPQIANYLKVCSTSFPGAQNASFSTLNSLQGILKVSSCSGTGFSLCRGSWQMLLASANLQLTHARLLNEEESSCSWLQKP